MVSFIVRLLMYYCFFVYSTRPLIVIILVFFSNFKIKIKKGRTKEGNDQGILNKMCSLLE